MTDFFLKAKKVHGNKYDYSKVNYINSRTKISIICPEHGEFWQTPSNHLYGHGCPKCCYKKIGDKKRLNIDIFVNKAKEIHGDKYDYSKVEYVNNSTKVCIICPEHGEFWQLPSNHLKGIGCPKCFNNKKSNTEEFINKSKKIHGDKYDYSKVEYINNKTKVCIICPEHGEFWQTPYIHLQGCGCPKCGIIKSHKMTETLKDKFIEKMKNLYNYKYDYSKVEYINNKTKVCIICPEHGEFWQTPSKLLKGYVCKKCRNNKYISSKKLTQEDFINKLKIIYNNTYDYSKVIYEGYYKPVTLICPKHGEFSKKAIYLLNKRGCPICSKEHYKKLRSDTTEEFINKSKKIHGNKYNYSKIEYINSKTKVCIICPKHGEFWQSPDKHLCGQGCPNCSNLLSNNEDNIKKYIVEKLLLNVETRNTKEISPYELDIFIPEKKVAIEYNGLVWHSEKFGKDKNYHLKKTLECEKQGIQLIHIFEDEWLEHENIVKSKIKHILGCNTDLPKIMARKCVVREIKYKEARNFLDNNHIQGACNSTIYFGCFYQNKLVGVMSFRQEIKNSDKWELTRFATDINRQCIGVGGKLFKYFIKNYKPSEIKSFADRRWSIDNKDNLYRKLGFKLEKTLKPEYRYTNGHNGRIHKFNCRKQKLLKKYSNRDLTEDMTEYEMTQKLGFYRIWDCGLYKYVWKNDFYI